MAKINVGNVLWRVVTVEPTSQYDTGHLSKKTNVYTRRQDVDGRLKMIEQYRKAGVDAKILEVSSSSLQWVPDKDWLETEGYQLLLAQMEKEGVTSQQA